MVRDRKWLPAFGARLYFGGIALVMGLLAFGCTRELPTGVEVVKGATANTWDVTYLCQLGYPGYEEYCDDFGGLACSAYVVDNSLWTPFNANCELPGASFEMDGQFRDSVVSWIYAHVKTTLANPTEQARCYTIRDAAVDVVSFDRVRFGNGSGWFTANGKTAVSRLGSNPTVNVWNLMAIIDPNLSGSVARTATTAIHEVTHTVMALVPTEDLDLGNDETWYFGIMVGDWISNAMDHCFTGLQY
jgi:hypothetical protein